MASGSYSAAGVDIDKGDRFVDFIRSLSSGAVSRAIGGFAAATPLDVAGYRNPVLLTTTDGVGTKLLVAKQLGKYDTVGIDLVAMCVNDLVVSGGRPLVFQDYIAAGRLDDGLLQSLVRGIVAGCEEAGCTLSGGETAELPGLYAEGDFDLAGFAVGIADRDELLPKLEQIEAGAALFGLPSSGIHSNGLSLARQTIPWSETNDPLWRDLLAPTKIYAREFARLRASGLVLAAAHVTGGGLEENLARVIPGGLWPELSRNWAVPPIFGEIQRRGAVSDAEMRRIFNLGIGLVVVVARSERERFASFAFGADVPVVEVGTLIHG